MWPLAICRSELSEEIAQLMPKRLWSGWKWQGVIKLSSPSPAVLWFVIFYIYIYIYILYMYMYIYIYNILYILHIIYYICFLSLKSSNLGYRKNVSRSWDIQILEFKNLRFYDVIKSLSMNQEIPFTESLEKWIQSGNEIWPVCVILQKKNFYQELLQKNVAWKLVSRLFVFKKN